jgi:hypothetical protein
MTFVAADTAAGGAAAEESGAATKADVRQMKTRARAAEGPYADAYDRGATDARAGRDPEPPFDDELAGYYQQGHDDTRAEMGRAGPAQKRATPAEGPPDAPSSGGPATASTSRRAWGRLTSGSGPLDSGAGLLLGAIIYANVVNYLRGGLPAVRGWWAAKFLNKPYSGPISGARAAPAASTAAATTTNVAVGPPIGVPPVLSGAQAATSTTSAGSVLA